MSTGKIPDVALDLNSGVPRNNGDPLVTALQGARRFITAHPEARLLLVGDQSQVNAYLRKHRALQRASSIIDAPGVVSMSASPEQAYAQRENTSMWAMISAVRHNDARAGMSAGNTSAYFLMSVRNLGRIRGCKHLALAASHPVKQLGTSVDFLDVGASKLLPTVPMLVEHALKGVAIARMRTRGNLPRVALLNIGEEDHKGHEVVQLAAHVLRQLQHLHLFVYVGFIEANEIANGEADVVVIDGIPGNHVIKAGEGTGSYARWVFDRMAHKNILSAFALWLVFRVLARKEAQLLKPDTYNGAYFAGLSKPMVKVHGSSGAGGYTAGLIRAYNASRYDLSSKLSEYLEHMKEVPALEKKLYAA